MFGVATYTAGKQSPVQCRTDKIVAPIPTRQLSPIVQPWTIALCPTLPGTQARSTQEANTGPGVDETNTGPGIRGEHLVK